LDGDGERERERERGDIYIYNTNSQKLLFGEFLATPKKSEQSVQDAIDDIYLTYLFHFGVAILYNNTGFHLVCI